MPRKPTSIPLTYGSSQLYKLTEPAFNRPAICSLLILTVCLLLPACASKPTTNSVKRTNAPQTEIAYISISKANAIIKKHLQTHNLSWGDPTMIRNAPNRYIYNFATPKEEIKSTGKQRRLVIDIHTGKVSVPTQSGGLFGKRP